jgi:hypothetical protein
VSPGLRRAAHQALDIILDALAAEQDDAPPLKKPKVRKGPVVRPLPPEAVLSPELQKQLDHQLAKAGYRRAG